MDHMSRVGRIQLGILALLIIALTAGTVYADWTDTYSDDFETDRAESDSHAIPPSGRLR